MLFQVLNAETASFGEENAEGIVGEEQPAMREAKCVFGEREQPFGLQTRDLGREMGQGFDCKAFANALQSNP